MITMISFKEFIIESIEDKGILKAIFIVGIPGAGKSYTAKKISGSVSPRIVNTDRATEFLIKKMGKNSTEDNWPEFSDKSHHLTQVALSNYINSMLPLFVDGTSNDASNVLHRAGILESLGYDVGMIFIETSLQTAIDRANARIKHTGREVSTDFIKAVESRAKENKEFFETKFKFFQTINNDEGELTDKSLKKAFVKVQQFYNSPLANPVGKRFIEKMKEEKVKYLTDIIGPDVIKKKVEGWYRT